MGTEGVKWRADWKNAICAKWADRWSQKVVNKRTNRGAHGRILGKLCEGMSSATHYTCMCSTRQHLQEAHTYNRISIRIMPAAGDVVGEEKESKIIDKDLRASCSKLGQYARLTIDMWHRKKQQFTNIQPALRAIHWRHRCAIYRCIYICMSMLVCLQRNGNSRSHNDGLT